MTQGDFHYGSVDILFRQFDKIAEPERLIQCQEESGNQIGECLLRRKGNDDRDQRGSAKDCPADACQEADIIENQE